MIPRLVELGFGYLELAITSALLLAAIQAVKYRDFEVKSALSFDDFWLISILTVVFVAPAWFGPRAALLGGVLVFALFLVLWLDAVLFRVFTIELGTGGLGTVVLSAMFRELRELSFARRFFAANKTFALLPPIAWIAWARSTVPTTCRVRSALTSTIADMASLALLIYLAALLARHPTRGGSRWVPLALYGALILLFACDASPSAVHVPLVPAIAGFAAAVLLAKGATLLLEPPAGSFFERPSSIRPFAASRTVPHKKSFAPRPEHAALLTAHPHIPAKSALFGRLRGADVVLVTFESMGRDHLAAFSEKGAHTPFLSELLETSMRSENHFCVSPNTNNAHVALYASNYSDVHGFGGMAALMAAGYRTVYLSPISTASYGLKSLLEKAGFEHIIDEEMLAPSLDDRAHLSDYALIDRGIEALSCLVPAGDPFFLHVHTTNTHVPYRVIDPARFHRFDNRDDLGRFLNGLEESDFIISRFLKELRRIRARGVSPLIVASGDHGQAFGQFGYQSHGSAVIKEEINVPLAVHHPGLEAKAIRYSSHFDVLPTILDLLGVAHTHAGYGDPIFGESREPCLLLWAGHPSRAKSSNFGLVYGDRKFMVDLIMGKCYEMDWNDRVLRELAGSEKDYYAELIHRVLCARGLT